MGSFGVSENRILARMMEVQDLPTLPMVMTKILEMADDDSSSVRDMADLVQNDHAIATRVLRLSNSAFYGLRNPVDSIDRAVVVLGFDAIRQLALATSVFGAFSEREQFAIDPEDFWLHSLGTAKAAQLLCAECPGIDSAAGCFTAGLIHDIGKYLLALVLKEEYKKLVMRAEREECNLAILELAELETSSADVGRWMAEKWRFPPMIVDVIGNINRVKKYGGRYKKEVALVALANEISCMAEFGVAGDFGRHSIEPALVSAAGLKEAKVNEIVTTVSGLRHETLEFFNVLGAA